MNPKLVESLLQIILSLSDEERSLVETRLFSDSSQPSTPELMQLADISGTFDFLNEEPDMYTLEYGEAI
ncbi:MULTISPECIES: hypothetical protein [unclassified Anabaena]|uniref:hypothetical protein n=1 Tax=unclassified Anabaena TaxID=2619674 RepID=UPI0039C5EFF1